jgi:hypothetical protein
MKRNQRRNFATLPPLTPDLTRTELVKVVLDTKTEEKLYGLLLEAYKDIDRLRASLARMREQRSANIRERKLWREIRDIPKKGALVHTHLTEKEG